MPTDQRPSSIALLQFSLKQLLLSVALVAVGMAYLADAWQYGDRPSPLGDVGAIAALRASCVSIGAGILGLFGKPWLGALLGVIAFGVLYAYLFTTTVI